MKKQKQMKTAVLAILLLLCAVTSLAGQTTSGAGSPVSHAHEKLRSSK